MNFSKEYTKQPTNISYCMNVELNSRSHVGNVVLRMSRCPYALTGRYVDE